MQEGMMQGMERSQSAYYVIYDGRCNLCVNLVRALEAVDQGRQFAYAPMQAEEVLAQFGITPDDCERGMILIEGAPPHRRWQGSDAAEEIGRRLPLGAGLVAAYRWLPGMKETGDRVYEQVRDHRYAWFGQRDRLYESAFPICPSGACGALDRGRSPSLKPSGQSLEGSSQPEP